MSVRQRRGVPYDGIILVVYRLSRLFKSKRCGTAAMTRLATTRLRSAGG
jgi:hypothetical protein